MARSPHHPSIGDATAALVCLADAYTALGREIAAAELEHAARQFTTVAQQVRAGESSQELLRAARARLYACARDFATTHGAAPRTED